MLKENIVKEDVSYDIKTPKLEKTCKCFNY